ncbi:MAG: hypothetical protein K0S63_474 [Gammaproteobacteria bacterium]|nr:hypothetical protein [Gammaproteobacteria bacterium]
MSVLSLLKDVSERSIDCNLGQIEKLSAFAMVVNV